jgi:hypothetical protein
VIASEIAALPSPGDTVRLTHWAVPKASTHRRNSGGESFMVHFRALESEMTGKVSSRRQLGDAPMTRAEDGVPPAAPTAAGDAEATPEQASTEEHTTRSSRIVQALSQAGREKSTQLAEQAKTTASHLSDKARTAATQEPKRSWGALAAAVTGAAGIAAGWVVRRRRKARRTWRSQLRRWR